MSPRRCNGQPTRSFPDSETVLLLGGLLGLVPVSALNFYGASLTLLSVATPSNHFRCTVGKRLASLLAAALVSTGMALERVRRFHQSLRRSSRPACCVPVHALDRDQPVDFYVIRNRSLFDTGDFQSARHVRTVELARPARLRRRIRSDDSVFSTGIYQGPVARALGGADIAMLVGLPVSGGHVPSACARSIWSGRK